MRKIRNNPKKLSVSRALGAKVDLAQFKAIKTSFKILDKLHACAQIEDMNEHELNLLQLALHEYVKHTILAGRRVLSRHYMRFEPSNFEDIIHEPATM